MRKTDDYMLNAKTTRAGKGQEAWWYANKGSIEVYVCRPGAQPLMARIKRSDLLRYIEQTEKRETAGS